MPGPLVFGGLTKPGFRYRESHASDDHLKRRPRVIQLNHNCDTCNECISDFFLRVQLSHVIDVSAVLGNPVIRESIAQFYRSAIQYALFRNVIPNVVGLELRLHGTKTSEKEDLVVHSTR